MLFAVSMTGCRSPPCFALPYVHTPENLARETTKCGGACIATGTGWITEEAFFHWLQHFAQFLDESVRSSPKELVMLMMDMCTSHYSPENFDFFDLHYIIPFYLPSGMTQFLQPADVGLFSAIKARYGRCLLELDRACTEVDIPGLMCHAVEDVCTATVVKNAFAATGVCPPDPAPVMERITQAKRCGVTMARAGYTAAAEAMWQDHCGPVDEQEVDVTDDTTQTPSDWANADQPLKKRQRRAGLPHPGVVTLKEYTEWMEESAKAKTKGRRKETTDLDNEQNDAQVADPRGPRKRGQPSGVRPGEEPSETMATLPQKRTCRADPDSNSRIMPQKRSRRVPAVFDNSPRSEGVPDRGPAVPIGRLASRSKDPRNLSKKKPVKIRPLTTLRKRKRVPRVLFDNSP